MEEVIKSVWVVCPKSKRGRLEIPKEVMPRLKIRGKRRVKVILDVRRKRLIYQF